jgi:hypothetical protein
MTTKQPATPDQVRTALSIDAPADKPEAFKASWNKAREETIRLADERYPILLEQGYSLFSLRRDVEREGTSARWAEARVIEDGSSAGALGHTAEHLDALHRARGRVAYLEAAREALLRLE